MRRYLTTAIDFPNAAPHMGPEAWEGHLAVSLPRAHPSLYGVLTSGAHETRSFGQSLSL